MTQQRHGSARTCDIEHSKGPAEQSNAWHSKGLCPATQNLYNRSRALLRIASLSNSGDTPDDEKYSNSIVLHGLVT
jgi:hypothetical protein